MEDATGSIGGYPDIMRTFYNNSNVDVTAAAKAYLASHRQLIVADLYVIHTAPNYAGQYLDRTFLWTSFDSPLYWGPRGTFLAGPRIVSRGEIESKIGLDAVTLDIVICPQDTDVLATDAEDNVLLTMLQGFRYGIFDNASVELWRVVMPTIGDCDTVGAYELFTGRVGNLEFNRLNVTMTINSRLELLNVQVPSNTIEATNIFAQYSVGVAPPNGPTSFTVTSGTTANEVCATGSHTGYIPQDDTYNAGYVIFKSGKLAGHYARVREQSIESGEHAFYLQEPLPFAPVLGDTLGAYVYVAPDQASALATGTTLYCFPYCPTPINSAVNIG